ncbi:MAG: 16S rRNA (adenine(1518)-N(6)/adenine(1519)-N(6))-dimethyltransferase RsmA [Alloprevotella sp.]|nr:16S rRNA (adenine(1518)-N(6)/adenine(1519)-N(6))-dimethyltransferase RsmA [Alloprevotella sp.]
MKTPSRPTPPRSVRPKKKLGQHFLKDLNTARAIADTVDACPDLPVLEVGPGMGVLTQYLLPKARRVRVVEIDRESVAYLLQRWPELAPDIIGGDFLRMDLREVFDGKPFVLTGNYPYDISSQIFFHVLEFRELIPCCTGMVQLEMAERLAARPGTKNYGILSVLLGLWYDATLLFKVPPSVFNPPPKVQSAVLRLTRNARTSLACDEGLLRRVVKGTFQQRRKMLRVSLRPVLAAVSQTTDWSALLAAPDLTRRPEQLSIEEFVALTRRIEDAKNAAASAV